MHLRLPGKRLLADLVVGALCPCAQLTAARPPPLHQTAPALSACERPSSPPVSRTSQPTSPLSPALPRTLPLRLSRAV
ncbi:hypothetical protein J6590_075752, partial [Homalodisca vitripennis]